MKYIFMMALLLSIIKCASSTESTEFTLTQGGCQLRFGYQFFDLINLDSKMGINALKPESMELRNDKLL